ncbi:MAG: hypothetical protein QGI35_00510 [Arenicellales bacterium]|jgi:hypothetical protein|uniref:Uncharacterized protein n=1 Tax=marine metagenome TaxID=408172 RepID=A0A381Y920_9ZZZZ|nr:hypothetical protein [Acidiferrobacteraceae bacterium]MDP6138242.1 hypothetical protein [Arenicellales bacterium]MDP6391434.1 hypothetical protein [Arenicellales bacterium]MDP7217974.1 hypothetical protein [Arenicellales bacterium]HJP09651.1 hypothetical protein [Arenicellales bacterium]|tara:strand:- start:2181 stop:2387 length:207 start_codon:yes stop_codon:yes gene_type:complete
MQLRSAPEKYYGRAVAHSDVKGATRDNPVRISRQEFVTRFFNAYLDEDGRYCENLVAEYPEMEPVATA